MNCGLEPPRVQVMVVCVTARFCSAAVSLVKRAKRLRVCPPMLRENAARQNLAVRLHRDRHRHALFAFGSNESAKPVVGIEPGDVVARLSADAVAPK